MTYEKRLNIIIQIIIIMIIKKFVNRAEELENIRERLKRKGFELIVIYGRRRIGKTRLILEAVKDVEHVYYLAIEGDNLRHFKRQASKVVPELKYSEEDWEGYFHFLKDKIVIVDEFQNLIKEDPKVISIFQRIVDELLINTNTKLILLGSSTSIIGDKVLSYKSPLYGRRTASLRLGPLKFIHLKEFFPNAAPRELVEIFGFTDGIPFYIEKVKTPFWSWLEEEFSRKDTFLIDEMEFLLKYEFTETSVYKKILEAIAYGKNTMKEIKDYLKTGYSNITPYIANLMEVGLVKKVIPITDTPRSKKGRYYITDNFTRFWFRYIFPNLSAIEEGIFDIDLIKKDYDAYLGNVYERVAREFMVDLAKRNCLPIKPQKIGKWWHKGEEIDLVLVNETEKKAILVEVKWKDLKERDVYRILSELERKAGITPLEGYEVFYCIIGRNVEGKEEISKEVLVYDLNDIVNLAI